MKPSFNYINTNIILFELVSLLYPHLYFRRIYADGNIYVGGWDMDRYHGKGEWEIYGGKTKEIGRWDEHQKQGEFQCYNQSGALTHIKIYKEDKEIKCEEVKHQI